MPKGKQYSELERRNLQELVSRYMNIIENKQTDAVSLQKKKIAWEELVVEYNANSENAQKDVAQLKKVWENIKFRRKAELAAEKRAVMKTGGGPSPKTSAVNNPDLDSCCNIDIEMKDVIDSDMLMLAENRSGAYVLVDNVLVPQSTEGHGEADSQPASNRGGGIIKAPTSGNEENSQCLEYINGDRQIQQSSTPEIRKGSKKNLFSEEAQLRIDKADYLLKLEKEIGEMRREEQSLKCELIKIQVEVAKQQLDAARHEEQFNKLKRDLELKKLM
ncbi:myb/SANT-like DNA-binding domain-containing protein 4 [Anabrus simplex]|uniref:myb/SANT-like DNA-binding domain-containing protein 4 n=1 Tax=Anabrus simplex TaxID=316456 RepID=UPI0035A31291